MRAIKLTFSVLLTALMHERRWDARGGTHRGNGEPSAGHHEHDLGVFGSGFRPGSRRVGDLARKQKIVRDCA